MKKILKLSFYLVFAVILPLLIYSCLIEPRWIQVVNYVFKSEDIPDTFNGTRIVFLTDIHHGPYFSINRVKKLVKRVNRLDADIICLGGDYVHRDAKYIEPVFNELKSLKSIMGIYGVLGNHDHWEGREATEKAMEKAGILLLDNSAVWLQKGSGRIKIAGVGDLMCDTPDPEKITHNTLGSDFELMISHNPDVAEYLNNDLIDLTLSGHTHGGQVTLFGTYAPLVPTSTGQKYRTGVVKTDRTTVIISNGIGTITPPVRFFARPQIYIVELTRGT